MINFSFRINMFYHTIDFNWFKDYLIFLEYTTYFTIQLLNQMYRISLLEEYLYFYGDSIPRILKWRPDTRFNSSHWFWEIVTVFLKHGPLNIPDLCFPMATSYIPLGTNSLHEQDL